MSCCTSTVPLVKEKFLFLPVERARNVNLRACVKRARTERERERKKRGFFYALGNDEACPHQFSSSSNVVRPYWTFFARCNLYIECFFFLPHVNGEN